MLETDASARGVDEDNLPIFPLFLKERNIVESYYVVCFGRLEVVFVGLLGKESKKCAERYVDCYFQCPNLCTETTNEVVVLFFV